MAPPRFDAALLATLLDAVGAHLQAADVEVSIVVVGGAALARTGSTRLLVRSGARVFPMASSTIWSGAPFVSFASVSLDATR
jgi:hypothetical protein